LVLLTF